MQIIGTLLKIGNTESFGANGFEKRECVLTTEEQYPQQILIEFVQGKVNLLDAVQPGQSVKIHFNLRGREWVNPQGEAKYFNTIQGWKIETFSNVGASASPPPATSPAQAFEPTDELKEEDHDDLPF